MVRIEWYEYGTDASKHHSTTDLFNLTSNNISNISNNMSSASSSATTATATTGSTIVLQNITNAKKPRIDLPKVSSQVSNVLKLK